jgi:FkbH-like protein
MDRLVWQSAVFADLPRPSVLLELRPTWPLRQLNCRVHRNTPFEHLAGFARPFLAYAGYDISFDYGDYDDSLSAPASGTADLELVWIDYGRYRERQAPSELSDWLARRIGGIRGQTIAPILVNLPDALDAAGAETSDRLSDLLAGAPGVHPCDVAEIAGRLGEGFWDSRLAEMSGWSLSAASTSLIAQRLGLVWIPAAVQPRLKAVVLDLDNTLYDGVLGEDSEAGITVTDDHRRLHAELVRLASAGLFLAIVSKNEPADVERLWASRADIGFGPANLSAQVIGWGSKSDSIAQLCSSLRIAADAMLVVDDNPGELAAIAAAHPGIRLLLASGPAETVRALRLFPGLAGFRPSETDSLRLADAQASDERTRAMAAVSDPAEYLRSLRIQLSFDLNPADQVGRLHELSTKTNQFNTGLLRMSEAEVARRLASPDHAIATVRLSDRLADSGIIAAVFATITGPTLRVDEVDISCRALGRGVEHILIAEVVSRMASEAGCGSVVFCFTKGPRNQPAGDWLEGLKALSGAAVQ